MMTFSFTGSTHSLVRVTTRRETFVLTFHLGSAIYHIVYFLAVALNAQATNEYGHFVSRVQFTETLRLGGDLLPEFTSGDNNQPDGGWTRMHVGEVHHIYHLSPNRISCAGKLLCGACIPLAQDSSFEGLQLARLVLLFQFSALKRLIIHAEALQYGDNLSHA